MGLTTATRNTLSKRSKRAVRRWLSRLYQLVGTRKVASHNGYASFDPQRPTVVVVSHEASITGAPILALNICEELSVHSNVIAILLRSGPLISDFQKSAVQVLVIRHRTPILAVLGFIGIANLKSLLSPGLRRWMVSRLSEPGLFNQDVMATLLLTAMRQSVGSVLPRYALVNSVVSAPLIEPLRSIGVAPITLIHEFSAYIKPAGLMNHIALLSSELVFSSELTLRDAVKENPQLRDARTHVLAQGPCRRPHSQESSAISAIDEKAHAFLRSLSRETILVLGAGAVQPRKGVDLFISVADQMRAHCSPSQSVQFVWIGGGYDPHNDFHLGLWLHDQIERSGLESQLHMFDESPAYDLLLERANLFLLPSRLDPLPNVAIDALLQGKPVLCFDKACGIANLLLSDPELGDACVAPYLNTAVMAQQAAALVTDPDRIRDLGPKVQKLADTWFNMPQYIATLEKLGEQAAQDMDNFHSELQRLLQFDALDSSYVLGQPSISSLKLAQIHLLSWRHLSIPRKPFPGLHPGIYREHRMMERENVDPFLHYLESGRPAGIWRAPLITPNKPFTPVDGDVRVALHIHVHYPELLGQILQSLSHNRLRPDLYITTNSSEHSDEIYDQAKGYRMKLQELLIVPNRGRDIGPLVSVLGKHLDSHYTLHGHMHTKKSALIGDDSGRVWRDFLVANLIGDARTVMADRIVAAMSADPGLGIVFPDDPNCVGWSANLAEAELISRRLNLNPLPKAFNFPIGTMFWARQGALLPLYELGLEWDDYPPEPLGYDGTILHAIERLLPLISEAQGKSYALTLVPGVIR